MAKKPTPYEVRALHSISIRQLSRESGLSTSTLHRLEDPWHNYNIHIEAAELFAKVFNMDVDDINWPRELVFRGRRPLSTTANRGSSRRIITTTITTVEEYGIDEKLCEKCLTYQTPVLGNCSICGA